jgi:hypothetical protein
VYWEQQSIEALALEPLDQRSCALTFGIRDIDLGRGRIRVERSASKVNSRTVIGTTKTHAALVGGIGVGAQAFGPDHDALVRRGGHAVPGR